MNGATAAGNSSSPADLHPLSFFRATVIIGAVTVLSGILGLAGLRFNITVLRSFLPGYQTMAFSTALLCIFFGSVLVLNAYRHPGKTGRLLLRVIAGLIAVAEALELPLSLQGMHFPVESGLVAVGDAFAGQPTSAISPGTAVVVIAASAGFLILLDIDGEWKQRERDAVGFAGLVIALISFTFLLSYLYGIPFLYGTPFIPMAAPTALALFFLGLGLMTAPGDRAFPLSYFTGPSTRARLLRAFVPLSFLFVFLEGIIDREITIPLPSAAALLVAVRIVVFSLLTGFVVFLAAGRLGGALETEEAKRKAAEDEVARRNSELEAFNQELVATREELERDIDERRHAEEALAAANRKLGILNQVTRHDILNQLTGIQGFLELASQECRGDARLQGYFERLIQSARTIENQVAFTKYYQELGVNAPVWQNVREIAGSVAGSGPFGGLRVSVETGALEIYADPLLEKVFYNLYDNAQRHGGHVTEIRIAFTMAGSGGILAVEDNGAGIPGPEKERIFERGVGRHTGLGLFLIREILAITGMTIRETGEPGKGARFEISVPAVAFRNAGGES